MAIHHSLITIC